MPAILSRSWISATAALSRTVPLLTRLRGTPNTSAMMAKTRASAFSPLKTLAVGRRVRGRRRRLFHWSTPASLKLAVASQRAWLQEGEKRIAMLELLSQICPTPGPGCNDEEYMLLGPVMLYQTGV